MSTLGERIKQVRAHLQLTQKEFGKPLGISYGHISGIEKGRDKPSDRLLRLISLEYNISYDWLETGQGEMWTIGPELGDFISSNLKSNSKRFNEMISLLEDAPILVKDSVDEMLMEIVRALKMTYQSDAKRVASFNVLRSALYGAMVTIVERYAKTDFGEPDTLIKLEGVEEFYLDTLRKSAQSLRELYLYEKGE